MPKLSTEEIKNIPKKLQLKIINILKKKIKNHEVIQRLFDDYDADVQDIDLIPMAFADLDVSARTDHGVILLNYATLQDGKFLNDDHYLVHEITHFCQQCYGEKPTHGGKEDYLENKYEKESFQNQTEYIADTRGDEAAEDYIEGVVDKHEVPKKDKNKVMDSLLGDD
jgi:hypothetical protein